MRVAIIGRTEILYDTAVQLRAAGHEIVCIMTAKEAPEYRRGAEDFRALAGQWAVPFASSARISEHHDFLAQAQADIAVSINYSGVIPEEITALFPLGILNAHGGDLPRYRGNACQAWAILNGEERIGLCIHRMIGGELDSGDIIARDYLPININTKVTEAWQWMSGRIPELMLEAVNRLEMDPSYILERQSADPAKALRCYPRKPEDGRIDWNKPAIDVLRLINACNKPFAGAFSDFEGEKLIVWDAELVADDEVFCAVPGQVTKIGDGFVEVACGIGKLRILEAEVDGRSEAPRTWIQSIRKRLT
jgi:UDP-4-amino-4-deoxy-L-arabinose formyltransferase/UDP-glucuronic acid dehydrogenase (UDP-4-keto-hexauronic acid decarboxylating)